MLDSIIPVILISIYLILMFLVNYYKNISIKKKRNYKIKLTEISPAVAFYCYNGGHINKLFFLTLINLVDRKYLEVKEEKNNTYLYKTSKEVNNLKEYEKVVISYIDNLISNSSNKKLSLELLDDTLTSDWTFQSILNEFLIFLKEDVNKIIGNIDRYSLYIFSAIISFVYFLQVFYFINFDLTMLEIILLSLPFTLLTLLLSDLLKEKYNKFSYKKYIIVVIVSIIVSFISLNIWNSCSNVDYLIFHLLMGIFVFMYQLLLLTNSYIIKTNSNCYNEMQDNIINQIDDLDLKNDIKDYRSYFFNKSNKQDLKYLAYLNKYSKN